jgi:penicillin amidase
LKKWNFRYEKDIIVPTFFDIFHDTFYDLLWDEVLQYKDKFPITTPEDWRTIALMRDMPTSSYFDIISTSKVETFADVAMTAFRRTFKKIDKEYQGKTPTWSDYKQTNIAHLAGKSLAAFGHYNVSVGGNRFAPNAITDKTGPSWRMVVELGEKVKAYGVYPGGQSGNPGSQYYDNFIEHWQTAKYYELTFMKSQKDEIENLLYVQHFEGVTN